MVDDRNTGGIQALLARNLRRLRIARQLSMSELARATGIGKATLSSIENGHSNPTIETLAALAAAMRVPLGELLEALPPDEMRVVRAGLTPTQPVDGIPRRRLDSVAPAGGFTITELEVPARYMRELAPAATGSRLHVYVIQGKLLAGPVEQVTELGPADYASFPSEVPHRFETGRNPARVLLISQEAG